MGTTIGYFSLRMSGTKPTLAAVPPAKATRTPVSNNIELVTANQLRGAQATK